MEHNALDDYLKEHLAGSSFGLEHAKHLAEAHEGTPLGNAMAPVAREIEEDRDALLDLMDRLGTGRSRLKEAGAWVAEKGGRPKFAGLTSGDSQLGALLALEAMSLGVEGKRSLWKALKLVADDHPELAATDLAGLHDRAAAQRSVLEEQRDAAAVRAFAGAP